MKVLLTGATGFIGTQLLISLKTAGHSVTPVLRRSDPALPAAMIADLRHDQLGKVRGYDVVVHAASTTVGAPDELWQGNVVTTQRLTAAATRTATPVVYLSTTGVYGRSSGRFDEPERIQRKPSSALSAARAAAEDVVLDAGGTVIRPHVVHGRGDRWVLPPLVRFMFAADAWLGGTDVSVAAITVERLAAGVTALLNRNPKPSIIHAAEPHSELVRNLVQPYFHAANRPLPTAVVTIDDAYARLRSAGVSRNAIAMLGASSSMNVAEFWKAAPECGQPVPPIRRSVVWHQSGMPRA